VKHQRIAGKGYTGFAHVVAYKKQIVVRENRQSNIFLNSI
jgi:hypothetical protein